MAKMPAFQFYPGDWRKDPGVNALCRHDRSVWFDMLCIMHESEERGVLLLAGKPMPEIALAQILNLDNQTLNQTLTTLLTYGVASRRDEDGAVICRRMVRDEKLCQVRRMSGKLGGNPALVNQTPNQPDNHDANQTPTPSSSSSSSSSIPKTKAAASAFVLPDWIDRSSWDAYEEMRKKLRKTMTDHARNLAVKDLADLRNKGHSPSDVLNQSVMRGWTGLFEIKGGSNGTYQGNQSRGNIRVEQQLEELRKAGVTIPSGRPEAGPEQDVPAAGRGDGFGSPGVVLEGVR